MEHFKIYSFLIIVLLLVINQTTAQPNRKQMKSDARDDKFGRHRFDRNDQNGTRPNGTNGSGQQDGEEGSNGRPKGSKGSGQQNGGGRPNGRPDGRPSGRPNGQSGSGQQNGEGRPTGRPDGRPSGRPNGQNGPGQQGKLAKMHFMKQFMQKMKDLSFDIDFSDFMNGNIFENFGEMMKKIDNIMHDMVRRSQKHQICYMTYSKLPEESISIFETECPTNFNCEAVNRTFVVGNYSVQSIKECIPETDCSKMVCAPWEECRPPFNENDIEKDDESDEDKEDNKEDDDEDKEEDGSDEDEDDDEEGDDEDKKEDGSDVGEEDEEKETSEEKKEDGKKNKADRKFNFKGMMNKGKRFHPRHSRFAHCVLKKEMLKPKVPEIEAF